MGDINRPSYTYARVAHGVNSSKYVLPLKKQKNEKGEFLEAYAIVDIHYPVGRDGHVEVSIAMTAGPGDELQDLFDWLGVIVFKSSNDPAQPEQKPYTKGKASVIAPLLHMVNPRWFTMTFDGVSEVKTEPYEPSWKVK